MCDYRLYYWQAPFRGNFVQLALAEAGCKYERLDAGEIYPERGLNVRFPGMAPPFLFDCRRKTYLAQMPAIMMYLGERHGFLPKTGAKRYLALKIIADCHDVLLEITNSYGEKMWTRQQWEEFRNERFANWLQIFERTGKLSGLKRDGAYFLGSKLSIADLSLTALLGPLLFTFPELEPQISRDAPGVLALCRRIEARPPIQRLLQTQREEWGDIYCGGQIEKSLRKVIRGKPAQSR